MFSGRLAHVIFRWNRDWSWFWRACRRNPRNSSCNAGVQPRKVWSAQSLWQEENASKSCSQNSSNYLCADRLDCEFHLRTCWISQFSRNCHDWQRCIWYFSHSRIWSRQALGDIGKSDLHWSAASKVSMLAAPAPAHFLCSFWTEKCYNPCNISTGKTKRAFVWFFPSQIINKPTRQKSYVTFVVPASLRTAFLHTDSLQAFFSLFLFLNWIISLKTFLFTHEPLNTHDRSGRQKLLSCDDR